MPDAAKLNLLLEGSYSRRTKQMCTVSINKEVLLKKVSEQMKVSHKDLGSNNEAGVFAARQEAERTELG